MIPRFIYLLLLCGQVAYSADPNPYEFPNGPLTCTHDKHASIVTLYECTLKQTRPTSPENFDEMFHSEEEDEESRASLETPNDDQENITLDQHNHSPENISQSSITTFINNLCSIL